MRKLILAAICAGASLSAQSAVVSSLPNGTVLVMPANPTTTGITSGTLGTGIEWSSTGKNALLGYTEQYGFNDNGKWLGMPLAAANDDSSSMQLAFDTPVGAVGAIFNYALRKGNATIAVYDANRSLIESTVLNFTLPSNGINQGVFYGFRENTANISYFVMSGAFIGATDFTVAAVPEPSTYAMLLGGLGLLAYTARRRRS